MHTNLRDKSDFIPQINGNDYIETSKKKVDINKFINTRFRGKINYLAKKERDFLRDLREAKAIVMKPAGKGGRWSFFTVEITIRRCIDYCKIMLYMKKYDLFQ